MIQPPLEIRVYDSFDAAAAVRARWDQLAADNTMLQWTWLSQWWRVYSPARLPGARCLLLCLGDRGDRVAGIVPLYRAPHLRGTALRFMGDGEVCSDYLRLLCEPGAEAAVASGLATWLAQSDFAVRYGRFDWLEIEGHRSQDQGWQTLSAALGQLGWTHQARPLCGSWQATLPDDWKTYCQSLSKSRRRKINKATKLRREGQVNFQVLSTSAQIAAAWPTFVALHQKRRESLHEPGCFVSHEFAQFLPAAIGEMADCGRAHLAQLTSGSTPLGFVLLLESSSTLAVYQSGFDPQVGDLEPGHLLNAYVIEWALQRGIRHYDFLRGDEHYKSGWGGIRCELLRTRWVAPQLASRVKHQLWNAGRWLKSWATERRAADPSAGGEADDESTPATPTPQASSLA